MADDVTFEDEKGNIVKMNTITMTDEELRAVVLQPAQEQEVWKAIMSDLAKARVLINGTSYALGFAPPAEEPLIRASWIGAYALSAEVALWNGLYQEASAYAEFFIKQANWERHLPGRNNIRLRRRLLPRLIILSDLCMFLNKGSVPKGYKNLLLR